jgi:hypothetical protein
MINLMRLVDVTTAPPKPEKAIDKKELVAHQRAIAFLNGVLKTTTGGPVTNTLCSG